MLSWFCLHRLVRAQGKPCPLLDLVTTRCVITILGASIESLGLMVWRRVWAGLDPETEMKHPRLQCFALSFASSHTHDYVISHLGPNGLPAGLALGRGPSPATFFVEALRQSLVISSENQGFGFCRLSGASSCGPATLALLLDAKPTTSCSAFFVQC